MVNKKDSTKTLINIRWSTNRSNFILQFYFNNTRIYSVTHTRKRNKMWHTQTSIFFIKNFEMSFFFSADICT